MAARIPVEITVPPNIAASGDSWVVGKWLKQPKQSVVQGQRLLTVTRLDDDTGSGAVYVKSPASGELLQIFVPNGSLIEDLYDPVGLIAKCAHPKRISGVCSTCGDKGEPAPAPAPAPIPAPDPQTRTLVDDSEARVRQEQQAALRLKAEKRLVLVLDLDHTLLHATDTELAGQLFGEDKTSALNIATLAVPIPGGAEVTIHVKFRPHVHEFLHEAHKLFELHIYTMGDRFYADMINKLLDPDGTLFAERVTSREVFPEGNVNKKNIGRLFPSDDSMVVIVDDKEDIWASEPGQLFVPNVVRVRPYHFWKGMHDTYDRRLAPGTALPASGLAGSVGTSGNGEDGYDSGDADDAEGEADALVSGPSSLHQMREQCIQKDREDKDHLKRVGLFLKECHRRFYEVLPDGDPRQDVKYILDQQRSEILRNVRICFTGMFHNVVDQRNAPLWLELERYGAQCQKDLTEDVTHLVVHPVRGVNTEKAARGRQMKSVFCVKPAWVMESMQLFKPADELQHAAFPVPGNMKLDEYRRAQREAYKLIHDHDRGMKRKDMDGRSPFPHGEEIKRSRPGTPATPPHEGYEGRHPPSIREEE